MNTRDLVIGFFGCSSEDVLMLLRRRRQTFVRKGVFEKNLDHLLSLMQVEINGKDDFRQKLQNSISQLTINLDEFRKEESRLRTTLKKAQGQVSDIVARFITTISSLLSSNSKSVEEIYIEISRLESEVDIVTGRILREEAALSLHTEDLKNLNIPLEDYRHAVTTLEAKINHQNMELQNIENELCRYIREAATQADSFSIALMSEVTPEIFSNDFILDIFDLRDALIEQKFIKTETITEVSSMPIEKCIEESFYNHKIILPAQVSVNGRGHHHRKVTTGSGNNRSSTWKQFPVDFSGAVNSKIEVTSQRWLSVGFLDYQKELLLQSFAEGRERAISSLQTGYAEELEKLILSKAEKVYQHLLLGLISESDLA